MTISAWINETVDTFNTANIPTPRLDAEVLLAHYLKKSRTWLHTHADDQLSQHQIKQLTNLVDKRSQSRLPLAYITGEKEFYGRSFIVTPDVLIPRPETEEVIEQIKQLSSYKHNWKILDVGTGSGAIGLTLKLELPTTDVTLSDLSQSALEVARQNAKQLLAQVNITDSDLLSVWQDDSSSGTFNIIAANLPYVDRLWETSPETDSEPALALYANDHGLELIKKLISQSPSVLDDPAYLVLEADPVQHSEIISYASKYGFRLIKNIEYVVVLQQVK